MENYQHLGLISFIAGWLGISILLRVWGVDRSKSISVHAANSTKSYWLMIGFEAISLISLAVFSTRWLVPTFDLSIVVSVCALLVCAGLFLAALIPARGGFKGRVHDFLGYGSAALFIPITISLALSSNLSPFTRGTSLTAGMFMTTVMILFAANKSLRKHHLYLQCAYILVFDLALLSAAYIQ